MSAQDEITALYPEWMAATRDRDVARLERIVAPGFRYTDNRAGHKRRAAWFEAVMAYELGAFTFESVEVVEYSDVAVAFVAYRQEARLRGETRSGEWQITDVWTRTPDNWQVVARSAILKG